MPDDNAKNLNEEPISLEPGPRGPDEDEPISLAEPSGGESARSPAVRALGAAARVVRKIEYKRSLNVTGQGATRCRLFHSKIAAAPLEHMEEHINEWLDGEEIEIKHVGQVIGTMEGKRPEPNLIVMVWY